MGYHNAAEGSRSLFVNDSLCSSQLLTRAHKVLVISSVLGIDAI